MELVIGDVHGCYNELMRLLEVVSFDERKDKLFFVGDYIDRGRNMKEALSFIKRGHDEGWAIPVLGNHEDMWINAVKDESALEEHAYLYPETMYQLTQSLLFEYVEWFKTLPLSVQTEKFIITHAGMESSKHLREHHREELLWTRDTSVIPSEFRDNKIVIHGHTPLQQVLLRKDRCNLDTGCVFGNMLSAMILDDINEGSEDVRIVSIKKGDA